MPATIAVWRGRPIIGLDSFQLEELAKDDTVRKASARDLAAAISQKATAATTVAGTMVLAREAGLRVFATGGIGGVHPNPDDVSADLYELARTPIAVVCAGAKSILDLPATLEKLESLGVPVVGVGTDTFPAFYLRSSGLPVSARVETAQEIAALLTAHWQLRGMGVVIAQPLAEDEAMDPVELGSALARAEALAAEKRVSGPALTPFLLARLAELTGGRTLCANRALIVANARLAAQVAAALPPGGS